MTASHTDADRVLALCSYIREHSSDPLTLAELGRQAGWSPFHLQRRFKAVTGVTPKQFQEGCRIEALKGHLRTRPSVTDAIYEAGFGSSSRVYERADGQLGMTPATYRSGGRGAVISYVATSTSLGLMMMGATDRGLCYLQFGASEAELLGLLRGEYPEARLEPMSRPYPEQFGQWMDSLARHLEGGRPHTDLPLDLRATAFQLKVWRYLRLIPAGEVRSYGEVAAGIKQPGSARAVARACATNRVAVVIPCHRVIRGDGQLGGYRWGLERKRALLDRERTATAAKAG